MNVIQAMEGRELQCPLCEKKFGKKSSLVRHQKICLTPNSNSRRKACEWCSTTKSKCDLQSPSCGRCLSRKSACKYKKPQREIRNGSSICSGLDDAEDFAPLASQAPPVGVNISMSSQVDQNPPNQLPINELSTSGFSTPPSLPASNSPNDFSFSSLMTHFEDDNGTGALVSGERPTLSPDVWLQAIVPVPSPRKSLSPLGRHSLEFSIRVLRTWPHMMAGKGQIPPIFHHTQLMTDRMATPLAHCYTIAKMWHGQCEKSRGLVHDTTVREMTRLFQNYRKFDEDGLLATLQAMAIYLIILLFPVKDQTAVPLVNMAIPANLQQLVNYVGSVGLVISEEIEHVRPSWEAWVNITSRRRAMFTLYLIHWSLSAYHGLQSFDCQELKFMLAPAPKLLWQATDRGRWESHYNLWLAEWERHEYLHGEISEIKPGVSLDARSEKWLGETDELGMLVMSLGEKLKIKRDNVHLLMRLVNAID